MQVVAVFELLSRNPGFVHERAIGALQIRDRITVFRLLDARMTPRDRFISNEDVAIVFPSQNRRLVFQGISGTHRRPRGIDVNQTGLTFAGGSEKSRPLNLDGLPAHDSKPVARLSG